MLSTPALLLVEKLTNHVLRCSSKHKKKPLVLFGRDWYRTQEFWISCQESSFWCHRMQILSCILIYIWFSTKLFFLNLFAQCGARIHNLESKSCTPLTEPTRHPCQMPFFSKMGKIWVTWLTWSLNLGFMSLSPTLDVEITKKKKKKKGAPGLLSQLSDPLLILAPVMISGSWDPYGALCWARSLRFSVFCVHALSLK